MPGPILLVAFTAHFGGLPRQAAPQTADRWFSADKAMHFVTSAVAQSMAFSSLRAMHVARTRALAASAIAAAGLGVGKEVYDRKFGGDPSWKDLTADGAGIVAASLVLAHTER